MDAPVLVVGPGAVGLALISALRRCGERVAVLARTPAAERKLARSGFEVTSAEGTVTRVSGGLIAAHAFQGTAKAVFLCVKWSNAAQAARTAKRWAGPDTPVVALQNGIGHEKTVRRIFGPARTVIGVCYFAADRPKRGELRLNGGDDVLLARHRGNEAALAAAAKLLARASFRVRVKNSEDGMLWTKAAFNAAVNPLGAACAVESGRLAEDPALRELSLRALSEAAAAAHAAGHKLDYPDMAEKLLASARNAPHQRNSMLQDLAAGRKTEAKFILGPLLASARRHKLQAPTLSLLSAVIERLEKRLAA